MSSLAASRADGFYFPPDWRPEYGGISKFQGSTGSNQYEKYGIIRFELPFDAWCLKCGIHMSKGLRFNAKKDKGGKYFTTQIWKFSMKCHSCEEPFVIKTDPENDTYNFAEGLRKHEQDYEPDVYESHIKVSTDEEKRLLASDPMYRLQHDKEDKVRSQAARERLEGLMDLQEVQTRNDYDANAALRRTNREKRKWASALLEEGHARGLSIPLVECNDTDAKSAKLIMSRVHNSTNKGFATSERKQMIAIQSQSIFASSAACSAGRHRCYISSSNSISNSNSGSKGSNKYDDCGLAKSKSHLSSEAKKQINLQAAMAKQATLSLNPKRLKISDPRSMSDDNSSICGPTLRIHPRVISAPSAKGGDAGSDGKKQSLSARGGVRSEGGKVCGVGDRTSNHDDRKVPGALQIIASYSDDDD